MKKYNWVVLVDRCFPCFLVFLQSVPAFVTREQEQFIDCRPKLFLSSIVLLSSLLALDYGPVLFIFYIGDWENCKSHQSRCVFKNMFAVFQTQHQLPHDYSECYFLLIFSSKWIKLMAACLWKFGFGYLLMLLTSHELLQNGNQFSDSLSHTPHRCWIFGWCHPG